MNKRLYVGNLDYATEGKDLEELFASEGTVVYAKVITGPDGRSRGFGFVEMETEEQAQKAMEKFNKYSFKDRTLVVNEARVIEKRSFGGDDRRPSLVETTEDLGVIDLKVIDLKVTDLKVTDPRVTDSEAKKISILN